MLWRTSLCILVSTFVALLGLSPAVAQESNPAEDEQTSESSEAEESAGDESADDESADDEDSDEEESARESEHGSYEWKRSYGGGVEYGLFFTGLERWNAHLLEPNNEETFDVSALSNFTFALEASLVEGSRLTVFSGIETPFADNPDLLAIYGGVEPAFAFRRDFWEMALGFGVGVGSMNLTVGDDREFSGGLVVLRPAIEVRRYFGELVAGYARVGFNQWLPFNTDSETLDIIVRDRDPGAEASESDLQEGGLYVALGVRFGQYPEHKKTVGDSDGDGVRDDVDDCPEEPEDMDGFEDHDGCPDPDNDGDGIPDDEDECPDEAEDEDGFEDDDGCPDDASDTDEDGIVDANDECPEEPEDMDGFEDEDGCPDPDNDADGLPDEEDECPDEKGIPSNDGCPSDIVEVGEDRLIVSEPIEFEAEGEEEEEGEQAPRVALTSEAEDVLEEVAEVLGAYSELAEVEIQSHTGEGEEEAKREESQKRAEAVRDFLVAEGIESGRLVAKGYGFSEPPEATTEGTEGDGDEEAESADEAADEAAPESRLEFHILKRSEPSEESSKADSSSDSSKETGGDDETAGDDEESPETEGGTSDSEQSDSSGDDSD